jgi:hypothetical protein
MAVSMKMTVFWDIALCSLVEVHRHYRGKSILKGSDDGILQSGLLSFCTLSIVWYSKKHTTFRRPYLSSSSGVKKGAPMLLRPLERANLNHCPVIEVSSFQQTVDSD